jgi:transposase
MARRTKRLWTVGEKRSICLQTTAPGVSVAHVARRYALNANVVFKWLRDPRFAPDPGAALAADRCFLPVEIVEDVQSESGPSAADVRDPGSLIEIDVAGGHRMRISGRYDPEALARLIRGLSG